MEPRLQCLLPYSTVGHVMKLLQNTTHNSFPVVTPDQVTIDKEEMDVIESLPIGVTQQNLRFRVSPNFAFLTQSANCLRALK